MKNNSFNFWQDHSDHYLEMALNVDHLEIVENSDGYGKSVSACGDTIEIFLTIEKDHIQWISINIDGCINTRACANTVAMLVNGKSIQKAYTVTPQQIVDYLESLPKQSWHCADLAVEALSLALLNYNETQHNPWKKSYAK